jgi:hypothetical protein
MVVLPATLPGEQSPWLTRMKSKARSLIAA